MTTYPETPGFKTRGTPTDPSPDMLAAEAVAPAVESMLRRCLGLLIASEAANPHGDGWTADEAAPVLRLDYQTSRARFSQLFGLGLVARAGKGESHTGHPQWRYVSSAPGRTAYAEGGPKGHCRRAQTPVGQPTPDSHRLSDRVRAVFYGCPSRGWTADEIAASLGVPPRNIRPRIVELSTYGIIAPTGGSRPSAKGQPQRIYMLRHHQQQEGE